MLSSRHDLSVQDHIPTELRLKCRVRAKFITDLQIVKNVAEQISISMRDLRIRTKTK